MTFLHGIIVRSKTTAGRGIFFTNFRKTWKLHLELATLDLYEEVFCKAKQNTFFLEFWKLGAVYFCEVKFLSQFSNLQVNSGRQWNNFLDHSHSLQSFTDINILHFIPL